MALPVLVLGVGGGIDMSRAMAMRQKIASAVVLACNQSALEFDKMSSNKNNKAKDYQDKLNQIIAEWIADQKLTGTTSLGSSTATTITVKIAGASANSFGGILGFDTVPISVTRDCSRTVATPPTSIGEVMFEESFEKNHNVASNSWTVLKNWNGWTTQDAGIEINGMPQLSGGIRFGNFFAELDSHCYVANCHSNSTMSREVTLTPGDYELRYWYVSRILTNTTGYPGQVICGTEAETSWATWNGQTNRIEVYVEKQGDYTFKASAMKDLCIYADVWTERKIPINIKSSGTYRISWRAAGQEDTVGGLIDYLRFCTKTCP